MLLWGAYIVEKYEPEPHAHWPVLVIFGNYRLDALDLAYDPCFARE